MAGESNFKQAMKELAEKVNLGTPGDSKQTKVDFDRANNETTAQRQVDAVFGKTDYGVSYEAEIPSFTKPIETTRISKGTSIVGEIRSEGDIELFGDVQGNVETKGNMKIYGKVLGDLKGSSIELVASNMQGNIVSTAAVKIDDKSKVIGNVKADSLMFDGKLKGDIDVQKTVSFLKNALLIGNISAEVVSVESGAKIQGEMKISKSLSENAFDIKPE